ncbi:efflux RND transporter periplasmic adaptor subunit [Rhizobium sp. BK602]|uniref:efflux RND transporter periplasmic adaptor subunit n=1 Tax=Rhizobium sp. BK602 TaxID=2586986 RepID=UPI00160E4B33|nr:efflux RND transporter periplasmic adaptor subunit [Rhizobium sp. BK602]MBB3610627.1 membrane fusion protein (multidrug efflux system) [Rhizobium sp. BK602]
MRMLFVRLAAACITTASLTACEQGEASAPQTPPPPAVGFVTVTPETLPMTTELPGRVAATRVAEVRPRVTGIVTEQVFQQGTLVSQGDVLYKIDPAPFQAQADSAAATLRRAHAVQLDARQTAERQEQLRKSNVTSRQDYDSAVARLAQADADVAVAEAGLVSARLNLQYSNVTAPISGRIGRALITEGALVSANGSDNLATIQQLDPIYADFTQPASDLIRLRKALADGSLTASINEARVGLRLDDGTEYPYPGRLLFSEAAVDATTGQVTLRGEFPNPDGLLLPGMYVRVEVEQGVRNAGLAVPQQAVQRDAAGNASLLVVADGNKLEQRSIVVGRAVGQRWIIEQGVQAGDRIVVDGFQRARAGATVAPQPWTDPAAAAAKPAVETAERAAAQANLPMQR